MTITNPVQQIRNFKRMHKLTPYAISLGAGLHINTLRDIDKKEWNPRMSTINKIIRFIEAYKPEKEDSGKQRKQ